MDTHKLLWHLDRVVQWQHHRAICPIYIEISPVSFCNHKCIYCALDFAMEQRYRLDTDVLIPCLEDMGRLGVRSIMFAGEGEPLLHRDLPKLVNIAVKAGIDVSITTNGTEGKSNLWTEMLPDLTWIRFSVDAGSADVYSRVHRIQAHFFSRTVNSIAEAVEIKRRRDLDVTIGIQFLVIDENVDDIEKAIQLSADLGVDYFCLKPFSAHPQTIAKKEYSYSKNMINHIQNLVDSFTGKTSTDIIFRRDSMQGYSPKEFSFSGCRALPYWGYVSSTGDFFTCSIFLHDERFNVGNITNASFESILNGTKRAENIRYGESDLVIGHECRINCRMARVNEFLERLDNNPPHVNFI